MRITITRTVGDHTLTATTDPENHVDARKVLRDFDRVEAFITRRVEAVEAWKEASSDLHNARLRVEIAEAATGYNATDLRAALPDLKTAMKAAEEAESAARAALDAVDGEP